MFKQQKRKLLFLRLGTLRMGTTLHTYCDCILLYFYLGCVKALGYEVNIMVRCTPYFFQWIRFHPHFEQLLLLTENKNNG